MRRRVDVNLDELDQIIDRSTRAPLSESEGQKLKTALHAMAERLLRKRNTEKTSAVLPPDGTPAGAPETNESVPAGHGRNSAAAFNGANRVAIAHATLHSGDQCPECLRGKSVPPERAGNTGKVRGTRAAGSDRVRDGATALQRLRGGIHRRRTGDGGSGQVRGDSRGDDRSVEVRYRSAIQAAGKTTRPTGNAFAGNHTVGTDGGRRETNPSGAGGVDPASGAGQRDAQRRHQHADSASDARAG